MIRLALFVGLTLALALGDGGFAPTSAPQSAHAADSTPASLRWDAQFGRIWVEGLSAAELDTLAKSESARKRLRVAVEGADSPILGKWEVTAKALTFVPRFPLAAGVDYVASYRFADAKTPELSQRIRIPHPDSPRVSVTAIYPTAEKLPENLLKFYLHFSSPVKRGEVYSRLKILDSAGKPIDLPFLELDEELWDRDGVRLTVLIDPGRIKRGLKPREDVGPVFEAGNEYTLVLDANWPDLTDRPLVAGVRKSIRIVEPDMQKPNPALWRVFAPESSESPLELAFPESLDQALAERAIWVADANGQRVEGSITLSRQETRWRFMPKSPWKAGKYEIRIDPELEDLAGNRPDRLFDADTSETKPEETTWKRSFQVAPVGK
ncbi:hypothetical protein [Tuwongella immobilis]|uniref:SbsA Ig-like domain-containing protein n=1 Tax=Tuwongella immobilis TaxID=692036 RepID=A0A6C2YQ82_9BACT|nr:hypothetical protein [Tuwongella immobilis]VIP03554.1 Uncharacterized protein OS=Singulisphaera acidiphila (strain ATCC BAA-1392 / DSM 18658 / VKM B-2454 / MOB10) GN=Sinac_5380 PE=4 SV=1 [Tuwongella immobilis]VTS04476.1 Uncharacterized protein OS=Singulisphaera acidiphila (strain ATCC BAA-1392 / DSM 18658 / VKM B-2454 / MOB10) GN=Sinac_5380 PE=4 SV=1 [Tuwongella immobilis]